MEPTLINWLHKIISSQKRFQVMLNNYSGFHHQKRCMQGCRIMSRSGNWRIAENY
jgi:hypothetical protein